MATYAEYLRQNGATDEEIKILDVASARKAYDGMVAAAALSAAEAAAARQQMADFKTQTDTWYNDVAMPNYQKMEREAITSKANEARARAAVLASQDEGLKAVAKEMGWETAPVITPSVPASGAPANFDPTKYVTMDRLNQFTQDAGASLARLQDMVIEYSQLYPNQRLNVSKLRDEALAAKSDVFAFYEKKFNIPAMRAEREKSEKDSYEKKLRDEGAAAARAELASTYGNPETRPMAPSTNPFAARPSSGRDKQPWEMGDQSGARVQRATKAVLDQSASGIKPAN